MTAWVLPTEPGWWWVHQRGEVWVREVVVHHREGLCVAETTNRVGTSDVDWLEPVAPPGTVARLEAERDEATAALRDIASSLAETGNGIVLQVPVGEGLAARIAGVTR
jgi:hypothetical protein